MEEKKQGAEEEIYLAPKTKAREMLEKKPKHHKRVSEILELREENRKVFRMSDGTEQAVFFPEAVHMFNEETQTYDDVDNTLTETPDKKHYVGGKHRFAARFSREEDNDELFSIEQGMHRVTVYAKRNKKQKNKGVKPAIRKKDDSISGRKDVLTFQGVEQGTDYEYSVTGNGVKENIIVKEKADVYQYPFVLCCENVTALFDEMKQRVAFVSNETGQEIFFIPAPFMTDANGVTSGAVTYALAEEADGNTALTVTADSHWLNAEERAFPVVIDPQIQLSGNAAMSTYSWNNGYLYNAAQHTVGTYSTEYTPSGDSGTGESMETAIEVPFNTLVCGSISFEGEEVWYKFTAGVEQAHIDGGKGNYTICTYGNLDTIGTLYDAAGNIIARNDNDAQYDNFAISAQCNYGETYYISVKTWDGETGDYKLGITYTIVSGENTFTTGCNMSNRMYMALLIPMLPRNPRIKKAELTVYQASGVVEGGEEAELGLYQVDSEICVGYCTPHTDSKLLDYAVMQSSDVAGAVSYTFDVTALVDAVSKGEASFSNLVLKQIDESHNSNNYVSLFGGAGGGEFAPQLSITYETNYSVNTSHRTHTHELGRFGQGSIDLQCGNLMFESEDLAWAGNRMPVTIRHLYNSALSDYQYTKNESIALNAANFSAMHLGRGFRLNLMRSMIATTFSYEGKTVSGYVYVGENGEEIYFKESDKEKYYYESESYCLYEDIDSGDMLYDPWERTLTQGDDVYAFDGEGRLIRITNGAGNHMDITYTDGRITAVTDGAGREFTFAYDGSGYLTSVTAPDSSKVCYQYVDGNLSTVTYPSGAIAEITYDNNKPIKVELNEDGDPLYTVVYDYRGDQVCSVTEYGENNGSIGVQNTYSYSAASSRTVVQTTEPKDISEGEDQDNVIKTVYIFDNDGNIVSEYAYTEDTGNTGVNGSGSGIHPYSGDGGMNIVSNSINLLTNHNFDGLSSWNEMESNDSSITISNYSDEKNAKFGKRLLKLQSRDENTGCGGVYQETQVLPAGAYTFSVYLRIVSAFVGAALPGAYIRVTTTDGTVLAESERICQANSEYIRLCAPFVLTEAQKIQVQILMDGKGMVYANAPQLEKNPYASPYNMLENGDFENDTSWSGYNTSYATGTSFHMNHSLAIPGYLHDVADAVQVVEVHTNRTTRETFTLSGWAKGYSLPDHTREGSRDPVFCLRAVLYYGDNVEGESCYETFTVDFSPCVDDWQFASVQFCKSKYRPVEDIVVYCEYGHNEGAAYFDNIQLVRDSLETNLSAEDFAVEPDNATAGTSNVVTDTAPTFEEAKDTFGNALTETTFTDGEFGTIYRSFMFNDDPDGSGNAGNDLVRETDARGNVTTYTVDEVTSRNEEVTDRCGNKTAYEYDAAGRTTKVTSKTADGAELANVSYAYDIFDNLTEIVRGDGMKYVLAYNEYHNLESIGVDGEEKPLVQYAYKTGNGRLKGITYANGHRMAVAYNSAGQLIAEKWFDAEDNLTAHYKYVYDGQGNIVRSIDMLSYKEYTYYYEEGRLIRAAECDITVGQSEMVVSKTLVNTILYSYDSEGALVRKRILPANGEERIVYYENTEDNTVAKFQAGGRTVTSQSKTDSFGRKVFDELQLCTGVVSRQFSYVAGSATTEHTENEKLRSTPTTQLVSQILLSDGRTLTYEYDAEERITKVTDSVEGVTEYTYDAMGQLLTETHDGEAVNEMVYDNYGNILQKNGIRYTYSEGWNDRLAYYDGKPITYDAQGNPLNYLGHTLTWEKGRQLKSFDGISFTYNANGIRTSKTVDGVRHDYVLDGVNILRETWGDNTLETLYDNEDSVCGIVYNGVPYYFHKNLQGDVIAIADQDGDVVARYIYDAWGKCEIAVGATNATIAEINPYRYRGYYFDTETGLYYLQSRYYDPAVARFINADDAVMGCMAASRDQHNLFNYCNDNPVSLADHDGYIAANIVGAVIGGVIGAVGGYFLTRWLADRLNLTGWKRNAFIVGLSALIGAAAAAIGYFVGPYIAKAWSVWSAKLSGLIKGTFKSIAKITSKKMSHINVSKHLWNKVMKKVTTTQIQTLIHQGIRKGTWNLLSNGSVKILYKYGGRIIVITGKVVNKVFQIGDAWVWNGIGKP